MINESFVSVFKRLTERSGYVNKKARQYIGLLGAIVAYYIIHEGAHLICALSMGVFKQINFMRLGVQIDVNNTTMTNVQMGIFCFVGVIATLIVGYTLVVFCNKICKAKSSLLKAVMYYITIILLLLDPLYLSILCGFFGGGDMNGIQLLISEIYARIGFTVLLIINSVVFWKVVLPQYTKSFEKPSQTA